jgi:light-regulated signal transduction histidine kinase (bacteriophytochrome)
MSQSDRDLCHQSRTARSEQQIGKLHLPFQRGKTKAGTEELGLGLFITAEIAQARAGRTDLRSDETKTCFSLLMQNKHLSLHLA